MRGLLLIPGAAIGPAKHGNSVRQCWKAALEWQGRYVEASKVLDLIAMIHSVKWRPFDKFIRLTGRMDQRNPVFGRIDVEQRQF